jgi:hypothetical protein
MTHLNETLFSCGIACSAEGVKMPAGNYQIDMLLANVCKQNVTRFPYEIARLAEDIAGGLMVTMPSAQDLFAEKTGPWVDKLLVGQCDTPTLDRMRVMRLVENLTLGAAAVGYRTESMHGAGSPQAQRIMIARQSNMAHKKQLARDLAGVGKPAAPQKDKLRKPPGGLVWPLGPGEGVLPGRKTAIRGLWASRASCEVSPGCSIEGVVHPSHFRHAVGRETCSTEGGLDGPAQECPKLSGESPCSPIVLPSCFPPSER